MTHLLRTEIEGKAMRDKYDALSDKVDALVAGGHQAISPIFSAQRTKKNTSSEGTLPTTRVYLQDMSSFSDNCNEMTARTDDEAVYNDTVSINADSTMDENKYAFREQLDDDCGSEVEESFDNSLNASGSVSSIMQHSLMNGSSASDWLFSSPISYRTAARYDARGGNF